MLPHEGTPTEGSAEVTQGLTLFLDSARVLAGCAALTGVEAISNGVPAFKPPESRNARSTLVDDGTDSRLSRIGITFLASQFGVCGHPEGQTENVVSIGGEVFGEERLLLRVPGGDSPRPLPRRQHRYAAFLAARAILARDRFMPRQFASVATALPSRTGS